MSAIHKPNQDNHKGGNRRPRRNKNNNRNRNNRRPKPLKLTFWQKMLKALGLFDEKKARKAQRKKQNNKQGNKHTAPKTNVRNAKTSAKGGSDKPHRRAPQPVLVESARLYVGNLSYDATEYDLEDLFKGVGTVKKVEIIYNRNTYKSKGYGFIQMLNTEEAKHAVEVLHDQPFMGRQLVVNGSRARKEGDKYAPKNNSASAE